MPQLDANPDCTKCGGEGEVYKHFANHKHKFVLFEWLYCNQCFPGCHGTWPDGDDISEIDGHEFDRLQKEEGYSDYTGW